MNKQQLATKIWETANQMRTKIEAYEYKDYILGFIFYKLLSDKEVRFLIDNGFTEEKIKQLTEDDVGTVEFIQNGLGYFIAYDNLFSTWIEKGKDFSVNNVRDALSSFPKLINPEYLHVYDKILLTLENGLSKLGDNTANQTKTIYELINILKEIPMDGKQDYDVLGFIYEYLLSMFAANAGKKAGEFYTPYEISVLLSDIIANHLESREDKISIYDPTSGSGSLLINIGNSLSKRIDKDKICYFAQEIKENTYNLTRMNLIMRGIQPKNINVRNGDTLESEWSFKSKDTNKDLCLSAIVSNPPYSQAWDPSNKEQDPRFREYGVAPKTKADYAFLLHCLHHLEEDGIMTIVLPHGVLFRGGEEGEIRKNLIEKNNIDTIIGLPANIFYGTGIPTIVIVLKKSRLPEDDILIVDASKYYAKEGKYNVLRASDIKRISDVVINRTSVDKFSKKVTRDDIRDNDYNLNIPRYVDSSEEAEDIDLYATMYGGIPKSEIECLDKYWNAFPGLKESLFTSTDTPYCSLIDDDVEKVVNNHDSIITFKDNYMKTISELENYFYTKLICNMMDINLAKEKDNLNDEIFSKLKDIPLVDKYQAYQVFHDEWIKISNDIEILQKEGLEAGKKVSIKYVIKKKDGKEQEVEEGYTSYVIPFELVHDTILLDESKSLQLKESRLIDIKTEYDEILDSLSEDDKESSVLNDSKDSFITSEVVKKVKELFGNINKAITAVQDYDNDSFDKKIVQVYKLIDEEKLIKSQLKTDSILLHSLTKSTIEGLSDEQVKSLLELKWIKPLITALNELPTTTITNLVSHIKLKSDKYSMTYIQIQKEIYDTQNQLAQLMDDLTGSEYDMKGLQELQRYLRSEKLF